MLDIRVIPALFIGNMFLSTCQADNCLSVTCFFVYARPQALFVKFVLTTL